MTSPTATKEQLAKKLAELLAGRWKEYLGSMTQEAREAFDRLPLKQRNADLLKQFTPPPELAAAWQKVPNYEKEKTVLGAERLKLGEEEQERIMRMVAARLEPDELADDAVPAGSNEVIYRAAGVGQQPWDLLGTGFVHRAGPPGNELVKDYLRRFYERTGEGGDSIVGAYRISNSNSLDAPLISTGPEKGERQGSSSAIWSFGIRVPALSQVTPEVFESTFGFAPKGMKNTALLTDTGTIDGASHVVFRGGGLGEFTWLTPLPADWIFAYIRLEGPLWLRRWRPFEAGAIARYKSAVEEAGYTP
jgi:hypothetical protein